MVLLNQDEHQKRQQQSLLGLLNLLPTVVQALSSPNFQTQAIVTWGRNVDGEAGFGNLLNNSFQYPTLNNDLTRYFVNHQGMTYNLAMEMPVGAPILSDVSLDVQLVTSGSNFFF